MNRSELQHAVLMGLAGFGLLCLMESALFPCKCRREALHARRGRTVLVVEVPEAPDELEPA